MGAEPFLGEICLFAGNFAPKGWAVCEGQLLPISKNQALFSILKNHYGGDGTSTFALPDLRGRTPVNIGAVPDLTAVTLGERGGSETASVMIREEHLPAHTHTFTISNGSGSDVSPGSTTMVAATPGTAGGESVHLFRAHAVGDPTLALNPDTIRSPGQSTPLKVPTRAPYLGLLYIIALEGIYPDGPSE